jgi:hypothetical protein
MQKEEAQKYGIYIPELKVFVYVSAGEQDFYRMLQTSGLSNADALNYCAGALKAQDQLDEFDRVVQEVSTTPYHQFCTEMREIDF